MNWEKWTEKNRVNNCTVNDRIAVYTERVLKEPGKRAATQSAFLPIQNDQFLIFFSTVSFRVFLLHIFCPLLIRLRLGLFAFLRLLPFFIPHFFLSAVLSVSCYFPVSFNLRSSAFAQFDRWLYLHWQTTAAFRSFVVSLHFFFSHFFFVFCFRRSFAVANLRSLRMSRSHLDISRRFEQPDPGSQQQYNNRLWSSLHDIRT